MKVTVRKIISMIITLVAIAVLAMVLSSCEEKEEPCNCAEYNLQSKDIKTSMDGDDDEILVCLDNETIEIDPEDLQEYLDNGATEGECETLALDDTELEYDPCYRYCTENY